MENKEAEKNRETKLLDHEGRQKTQQLHKWNKIQITPSGVPEDEDRDRGAEGLVE